MKKLTYLAFILGILASCGGGDGSTGEKAAPGKVKEPANLEEASKMFMDFPGIGPVKPFELPAEIDQGLAAKGKETFDAMCMACHKPDKKFIGPPPMGILERRQPSWIMNMILNPEEMLAKDPIAKLLYVEFNMSPMANQNLTEEQARAVLEYFRTL